MSSNRMPSLTHETDTGSISENSNSEGLDTSGIPTETEIVVLGRAATDASLPPPVVGKVNQVNYTLNDTAALKKKLRHETNRKEPFTNGSDAKDGSNVVILLKTSFFEHMKMTYLKDLSVMAGITEITNALATKASTNMSGDAFVEYALDVRFIVSGHNHGVKLTAYPTTCKVMIQPLEKVGFHQHLNNRSVTRYFTDVFLLPWCENAASKKKYNDKDLTEALKAKIVELDLQKVKTSSVRNRLSSATATHEAKCVAKACKYNGLNLNNKLAVGVCSKCGLFEHFECSKTKQEDRELILKGQLSYYCSDCFIKNPTSIAFQVKKTSPDTQASAPVTSAGIAIKCSHCDYETGIKEDLITHSKNLHGFVCNICNVTTATRELLEEHMNDKHLQHCEICEKEFKTVSEILAHIKEEHGPSALTAIFHLNLRKLWLGI